MIIELKFFNIAKQSPDKDDGIVEVDLIKELVYYTFSSNLSDNLLQTCLTHFSSNFDIDILVNEVNTLLDSSPCMDIDKWKLRIEQLAPPGKHLIQSLEASPKVELNRLPDTLEYAFLGEENTLLEINSSSLDDK